MIQKIGIIGNGKMGTDIFYYLLDYNFHLTWFILLENEKEKNVKSFSKRLNRQLKHKIISEEEYQNKKDFVFTNSLEDLKDCDLVIESITEDKNEKLALFESLKNIVSKESIVVSNSSSIKPSLLSGALPVAGMHFFYPVSFKNTVELLSHPEFGCEKTAALELFLKQINKKVFLQNENQAFILNRFLLFMQFKAFELSHEYKLDYGQLDLVSKHVIPDFGLFELMDHVGLKTMHYCIDNYANMEQERGGFDKLLAVIQQKINSEEKMVTGEENEVENVLLNEIQEKLVCKIKDLYKDFVHLYSLKEDDFQWFLNDFFGFEIEF